MGCIKLKWKTIIVTSILFVSNSYANVSKEMLRDLNASNEVYLQQKDKQQEWYSALKRNAQSLGFKHGFASMMKQQKDKLLKKEDQWNVLFNFDNVTSLMQSGVAEGRFFIGGVVDKADESVKSVDDNTVITNDGSYVMVKYPRVSITKPNWKDYLFLEQELELSPPPESVLPRDAKERRFWQENIEIGWERGENSSMLEMRARLSTLVADLRGMIRYWTLIENDMLKNASLDVVREAVNLDVYENSEKLTINPTVVSISSQATFNPTVSDWNLITTMPNQNNRRHVRDHVIDGDLLIDDIENAQIIIQTKKFEKQRNEIKNDNYYK